MTTAAYDTFIRDPGRVPITLMEVQAWVIDADEAITLYYASSDFATETADTPDNQRYEVRIITAPSMTAVMDGIVSSLTGLMPSRDGGTIELFQINGDLDRGESLQLLLNDGVSFHDLSFGGRPVVIRHGGYSPQLGRALTYDEYAVLLDGRCDGDPKGVEDRYTFKLATKDRSFEQVLQPRVFSGYGPALHFNGTNSAINFGAVANFTTTDFTWKFSLFLESAPASAEFFICKGTSLTDGYRIGITSSGRIIARTSQAAADQDTVSGDLPLYQMVDVVVVRDGAGITPYIEGRRSITSAGTHIDPTSAAGSDLFLGRNNAGAVFAGPLLLTEVVAWDRALTKDEVNDIIHRRLDTDDLTDPDIVFYAPLNEGTGSNVEEVVGADTVAISGTTQWVHSSTGQPDIEGENVPDPWGPQFNWPPRMLDNLITPYIYMVSGIEIDSFMAWDGLPATNPASTLIGPICENGFPGIPLDTTKGTAGIFSSYITFVLTGNEPAAGKHTQCITPNGSYIRMRSKPTGPITVNFFGNAPGGTYLETTADQIEWVVQNRGTLPLTAGELIAAEFTQYNIDAPQAVGHMYEGGETISDFINFALRSTGGLGWFARENGGLGIRVNKGADDTGLPTPTVTLTEVDVSQLTCLDRSKPIWRVEVNHALNHLVMGTSDMLPGVVSHKRASFLRHEWRTAKSNRLATRADFLDAIVMIVSTGLTNRNDAQAEAKRLGNLYKFRDRAFRFLTKFKVNFDRMERVYFHFQGQIDNQGNIGSLLATHATLPFLVMEVTDDPETGGSWVTAWRESR